MGFELKVKGTHCTESPTGNLQHGETERGRNSPCMVSMWHRQGDGPVRARDLCQRSADSGTRTSKPINPCAADVPSPGCSQTMAPFRWTEQKEVAKVCQTATSPVPCSIRPLSDHRHPLEGLYRLRKQNCVKKKTVLNGSISSSVHSQTIVTPWKDWTD